MCLNPNDVSLRFQSSNFHKKGLLKKTKQKTSISAAAAYAWFYFWPSFKMHHFRWACVYFLSRPVEKTAVGARGCPGWPLRHGDADARGVKVYSCWEVTPVWPAPENIYLHHLFLTRWSYTAGNLSLWMAKVLNYWSAVKQNVWEPEIKTLTLSHWNNLWLCCHFLQETSKVFAFVSYWFLILLPGSS